MLRRVVLLAIATLLHGCASLHVMSHVPFSTIKRLWSFDAGKLDPVSFRVAARLPDVLEPREVKVTIDVARDAQKQHLELILERAMEESERAAVAGYVKTGHTLHIYRASAHDAARITKLRDEMLAARADGNAKAGNGQIAAAVKACRRGDLKGAPLPVTTLMRTDRSGYFVLLDELDLHDVVSTAEFDKEVPPCP